MNKIFSFKKLFLITLCFYFFGVSCAFSFSSNKFKPEIGKLTQATEYITETDLGSGIINKETLTTIKYIYDGGFTESPHKYITAKIENIYLKATDRSIIAISKFEQNFRYTTEIGLAECLSVSKGNVSNNSAYNFDAIVRRSNKTHEKGCGSAKIKFKHLGRTLHKKVYEVSCDTEGNIVFE